MDRATDPGTGTKRVGGIFRDQDFVGWGGRAREMRLPIVLEAAAGCPGPLREPEAPHPVAETVHF